MGFFIIERKVKTDPFATFPLSLPNVLRHIKPCRILDVDGVFLFLLVVNMRLSRIGLGFATAMMGVSNAFAKLTDSFKALSCVPPIWTQPSRYKSKPNKVSQAKRRKYVRQGRR